jgi:thermitase
MMRVRLLLLLLLLPAGGAWAEYSKVPSIDGRPLFLPGEVLVRFKENTADLDKARVLGSKTQSWAWEEKTSIYHVKLADGEDVQKRVELLKNDPAVELVQPNYCYYALACTPPSVYYYSSPYDWPLTLIQAPQAWNLLGGNCPPGTGVTVAVLDTGVWTNHPDLSMINYSKSVTNCLSAGSTNINDQYGHGTFVAGILAGQWNATGMAGLAPGITLMPIKVLDQCGNGSSAEIAAGTLFAVENGAKVLNFSLGGAGSDPLEQEAVAQALSSGCVVVAASGNQSNLPESLASLNYPAAYPGVIAVGASDENDQVSPFSNGGTGLDLVAPGGTYTGLPAPTSSNFTLFASQLIFSTILNPLPAPCAPQTESDFIPNQNAPAADYFGVGAGTSAAAPYVTATAALLFSLYPNMTNNQVVNAIINNTDSLNGNSGWDANSGYGRLNVYKALLNAQNGTGQITNYVKTFNSPNPFYPDSNPPTNITLVLNGPQAVELTIRDSGGETVLQKNYSAGALNANPANPQYKSFYISWDGRNASGQTVATGVYFYTVTSGGVTGHNKIVVVRGNGSP